MLLRPPPSWAQGRTITWLKSDFRPFYIEAGPFADQGVSDRAILQIQREIPDWSHRTETGGLELALSRIRAGDHVCAARFVKTPEREEFIEFSVPYLVLPPTGISIREEDHELFGTPPVSLAELLERKELKLAVALGRQYGGPIDELLKAHRGEPHVYHRRGKASYPIIFDLLAKGSVDYILSQPAESRYFDRERGGEGRIISLPIVENSDYLLSHVGCPKNAWGREAVAAIDQALRRLYGQPEYRATLEAWLDEERIPAYRAEYAKLLVRAAGSD